MSWRSGLIGWGLLLCLLSGCSHSTVMTQADIRMYDGSFTHNLLPAASDSLVCVSYNIAFSEKLEQAVADLGNPTLPRPDILLLQEMDVEGTVFIADRLGLNYAYFPSFIHPHHGRLFGNAVLSPWPMENLQSIVLPHANPWSDDRRAALAVDVQVGDRVVQAVSVHLSTLIVELDRRVEQVVVIRDSLISEVGPVIVGGDFNSGNDYESILMRRVVRKAGFREARLPEARTARGGALDMTGYKLKLDHIFYRDMDFVASGISDEAQASDHLPIWSVFHWRDQK